MRVLLPSNRLGFRCDSQQDADSIGCFCSAPSVPYGVVGNASVQSLASAGCTVTPCIDGFAGSYGNGDGLPSLDDKLSSGQFRDCEGETLFLQPNSEYIELLTGSRFNTQEMIKGMTSESGAHLRRAHEVVRGFRRTEGVSNTSLTSDEMYFSVIESLVMDTRRNCDLVLTATGKKTSVIPPACADFISSDSTMAFGTIRDAAFRVGNSNFRSELQRNFAIACGISGFGLKMPFMESFTSSKNTYLYNVNSRGNFFVHMSSGMPHGWVDLVNSTKLPHGSTFRAVGAEDAKPNFQYQILSDSCKLAARESGLSLARFAKTIGQQDSIILCVSSVLPTALMGGSWYGMLPIPEYFIDEYIRPMLRGIHDGGGRVLDFVIGDNMEEIISAATSTSNAYRFSARRSLEHQFLGRRMISGPIDEKRDELGHENALGFAWDHEVADPELGNCMHDIFWADMDGSRMIDWKGTISSCVDDQAAWSSLRFIYPDLPAINPVRGMSISSGRYNNNNANSVASSPSLSTRQIVAILRWEMVEWARRLTRHLRALADTNARYTASVSPDWSISSAGTVDIVR